MNTPAGQFARFGGTGQVCCLQFPAFLFFRTIKIITFYTRKYGNGTK